MIKIKRILHITVFILILAALVFSFNSTSNAAAQPATVDDLFKFLIDNWANKRHFSFETKRSIVDGEEVNEAFKKDVIDTEPIYGHLPEYWELRATLDLRLADIRADNVDFSDVPWTSDRIFSLVVNPVMLQKALELDPSRAVDQLLIGLVRIMGKFPKNMGSYISNEAAYKELYAMKGLLYEELSNIDPGNAFYLMNAAGYRYQAGYIDECMDLVKRASTCEVFNTPNIFPASYALSHLDDYEQKRGIFENLTPRADLELLVSIGLSFHDLGSNLWGIKVMYQGLLPKVSLGEGRVDEFNALQRAACIMGKQYDLQPIHSLAATVLIGLCIKQAMLDAQEVGDTDTEFALLALMDRKNDIRAVAKGLDTADSYLDPYFINYSERVINLFNAKFGLVNLGRLLKEAGIAESNPMFINAEKKIFDESIIPIFEDLYTFDYANPSEWYDAWYAKNFPPPEDVG